MTFAIGFLFLLLKCININFYKELKNCLTCSLNSLTKFRITTNLNVQNVVEN